MQRVGVLSNPRSGTSLMVRLLVLGFDLSGTAPLFPRLSGEQLYEYRADARDLREWATKDYFVLFLVRDPRAVLTSSHPSNPSEFMLDFSFWKRNYEACQELKLQANVLELKYERLLEDPDSSQQRVSSFLGVPIALPFSEAAATSCTTPHPDWNRLDYEMGSPRPLDMGTAVRWRRPEFKVRLLEQLTQYPELTDVLVELGYEADDTWVKELHV